MTGTLAYIPFVDPLNAFHDWSYLLLIPLAFGISMIYRALKMANLDRYWQAVATMTLQIVVVMAALGLALVVVVQVVIPRLPVG